MNIELYSFFSGLGFLDLGFENTGFKIEFVNEHNMRFLDAYKYARRNSATIPKYGYSSEDIRVYLSDDIWQNTFGTLTNTEHTLIGFIGGPPCPDFSTAGKNKGASGSNGQLTSVYTELILRRQPDFFVLENVKGLYRTKKHKEFYESIKDQLNNAGYSLFDSIENALEYGVPQFRDRLFLVGFKRQRFGNDIQFSLGNHKSFALKDILSMEWPTSVSYIENQKIEPPTGIIQELTVEHWFNKNQVTTHPNGQDIFQVKNHERYTTIPEGHVKGKSFKRLHRWRYSPTAAYGNNEVHLHPYLPRRISVAEALSLQSLPLDFELPSNLPLSLKFKMVGNGVPYLLALGIASDIKDWLKENYTTE